MKKSSGLIRLQKVQQEKLSDSRELRRNMTDTEVILWQELRNRRLCGFKFRRQQVIEGFVTDFYCEISKLAVEIDGGIHAEKEQKEIDEHREKVFQARGIKTIRFQNNAVAKSLSTVLEKISEECKIRTNS